jgi:Ca-activated chloride channel family protein
VVLALVNVTVTEPTGRPVAGLEKDNFRIYEDGIEQEIVTFSSEDVPTTIGLIFDMSGSMTDKIDRERQAFREFLKTSNPRDEFFLVSFNSKAKLTAGFTSSAEGLQNQMLYTVAKGSAALFDAIGLGLKLIRGAHNSRHVLLILSDGGDNHSRLSENATKKFVREADCQIYALGIFANLSDPTLRREEREGPRVLTDIAEMSGGRMFPVTKIDDLPSIASEIGIEVRGQYLLGYRPSSRKRDGKWRKIKVSLKPPNGLPPLTVHAKTGYYAPRK